MDVNVENVVVKVSINNLELNTMEASLLYNALNSEVVRLQEITAKDITKGDVATLVPNILTLVNELEEQGVS